jgi:hypothetical protein
LETAHRNRKHHVDEKFDSDISNAEFSNRLFIRLVAKGKRFKEVDFKYTIFDTCYLRNCIFDLCDFTGCRFISVNFYGASFNGCKFDYATFERTIISSDILDIGCPGWENLKFKFARTLRMNFQQLGDSASANKAIKVELEATESHLYKAWKSNESYYRKKYVGLNRARKFFEWLYFRTLDFIWGNGESASKLVRSIFFMLLLMTLYDVFAFKDATKINSYWNSLWTMPEIFIGVTSPSHYHRLYLSLIVVVRLIVIGLFLSILIKKFNRR